MIVDLKSLAISVVVVQRLEVRQTALGGIAAGGVFGGPEGAVGGAIGGAFGGVAGVAAGAALGAQVKMMRESWRDF